MLYNKDKEYTLKYITTSGDKKELKYTPEKDMSVPQIINMLKEKDSNFFTLLKEDITLVKENKLTEERVIIDNLYDLLMYRDFEDLDITDSETAMIVAYSLEPSETDNTSIFLTKLAKSLKIEPIDIDDISNLSIVTVNLSDWVRNNFDLLDSLFDVSGEDKESEVAEMVEYVMPGIISGNVTDSVYDELNSKSKFEESIDNGMIDLKATSVLDEDKQEDEIPYDNTTPKKCPKCGKTYTDFPALSRRDNKTYICPECGVDEAMEDYFKAMSKQENLTEDLQGTGEDQTQTQEDVEQAVSEVENPTEEDKFAVETANSSIDVLIADEQQAIDGYKAFLHQCEETIVPTLYDVLQKEVNEIIADEEDHINKLNTIKSAFHLEDIPLDESKKVKGVKLDLKEESNLKYKKGDIVPYKGKEYKIVKAIPAHYWKGQNDSEEGEDNSFVEFTDDMYEIQNPNDESDWGYVKADQLNETYALPPDELTPEEEAIQTKYDQVLDELEIDLDSPAEIESAHMIKKYIINHPKASVDEIVELYNNYNEFGDTTILENKKLNESDKKMYADLAEKMEKEIYNYLIENEFNPFDIDPDNGFADESLSEILEDYQSNVIEEYMKNHNVELMWECDLNHFKPYGIEVTIW